MAKVKRGYCGKEYDDTYCGALDDGSPACPECVEYEERELKKKYDKTQRNMDAKGER